MSQRDTAGGTLPMVGRLGAAAAPPTGDATSELRKSAGRRFGAPCSLALSPRREKPVGELSPGVGGC